jgi:ALG6, ALG8 glycosyltransferase family
MQVSSWWITSTFSTTAFSLGFSSFQLQRCCRYDRQEPAVCKLGLLKRLYLFQSKYLSSALWFSILLNLKHIYLYIAPAYGVYLLRNYCMYEPEGPNSKGWWILGGKKISMSRVSQLLSIGALVCLVSFGPFIAMGQFGQVHSYHFVFYQKYNEFASRYFQGCFHSKEVCAMHTGLQTSGRSTIQLINLLL